MEQGTEDMLDASQDNRTQFVLITLANTQMKYVFRPFPRNF